MALKVAHSKAFVLFVNICIKIRRILKAGLVMRRKIFQLKILRSCHGVTVDCVTFTGSNTVRSRVTEVFSL